MEEDSKMKSVKLTQMEETKSDISIDYSVIFPWEAHASKGEMEKVNMDKEAEERGKEDLVHVEGVEPLAVDQCSIISDASIMSTEQNFPDE